MIDNYIVLPSGVQKYLALHVLFVFINCLYLFIIVFIFSPTRMMLPSGDLFFLKVTKKLEVTGTYWCIAYNSFGRTKSREATLQITYLGDEFMQLPPPNVDAPTGQPLTIPCEPPRGSPRPVVSWLKNDIKLVNSSSIQILPDGDLYFRSLQSKDSGHYECVASNEAGAKKTRSTRLTILGE